MPDPETSAHAAVGDVDNRARDALARHAWREAFDLLSAADAEGRLAPEQLELLAQAAWWTGQLPVAIDARERAFGAASRAGHVEAAVTAAVSLARDALFQNDTSVGNAWLNRAERLLEGSDESVGHGWLASTRAFYSALTGDTDRWLTEATRAQEIAARVGDRDLAAFAASEKGAALIATGRVQEGLALMDEAAVSAVGGELTPETAGGVCCTTIESCAALGDYGRAATWTEAQDRWCRREGINGFPGMCRLFRSQIKQMRGSWLEAEAEARQASLELQGFMPAAAGLAFVRIGEIRRLRGDFPGAEEAFVRAHAFTTDAEPSLSLLRLDQGRIDLAAAGIRRALDEPQRMPSWRAPPGSGLYRLPLLRAQVEIALAGGDLTLARAAADELDVLASTFASPYARATAGSARGSVQAADGETAEAERSLRDAIDAWTQLANPYEAARVRILLADAHLAGGDREGALLELSVARTVFEQLGATIDLDRVDVRLAKIQEVADETAPSAGDRVVRTLVFTDIVDSTRLAEVLGDESWTKLLRWHDQLIRAVVAEHGGEEIKATGDGFFLAFSHADAAIDAMIDLQRRLAEHRERQGFAPAVRIGIHTAEANRAGLDYMGLGVNAAARIGAAAEGDQILVSAATLGSTRRSVETAPRRTLHLKGISDPVEVASVPWS